MSSLTERLKAIENAREPAPAPAQTAAPQAATAVGRDSKAKIAANKKKQIAKKFSQPDEMSDEELRQLQQQMRVEAMREAYAEGTPERRIAERLAGTPEGLAAYYGSSAPKEAVEREEGRILEEEMRDEFVGSNLPKSQKRESPYSKFPMAYTPIGVARRAFGIKTKDDLEDEDEEPDEQGEVSQPADDEPAAQEDEPGLLGEGASLLRQLRLARPRPGDEPGPISEAAGEAGSFLKEGAKHIPALPMVDPVLRATHAAGLTEAEGTSLAEYERLKARRKLEQNEELLRDLDLIGGE